MSRRVALIGHRGVGKTSLLTRIESAYQSAGRGIRVIDLDREIETRSAQSVSDLFKKGEVAFRELEISTLKSIESEIAAVTDDVYVSLGAGFQLAALASTWTALWVRRVTDEAGRIFTDRPRLETSGSALDEYKLRYQKRTPLYAARADEVLFLDEGIEETENGTRDFDASEREYFLETFPSISRVGESLDSRKRGIAGALTLQPENFNEQFEVWVRERVFWGVRWIELRDDLLSEEQIARVLKTIPLDKILLSFRKPERENASRETVVSSGVAFDWPVERAACTFAKPRYLSLHARESTLEAAFAKMEAALKPFVPKVRTDGVAEPLGGTELKAALPIHDFNELMIAHRWQQSDPKRRIVLPMSPDGRWSWYRLLQADSFSLNFFRESGGSAADQPTLLQWVRRQKTLGRQMDLAKRRNFAAVLGDPVAHSRTPMEQAEFFYARAQSVFAVRVTEDEWRAGAPEILAQLGLKAAAVTAPLKRLAYESLVSSRRVGKGVTEPIDATAAKLKSVNTLVFDEDGIIDGTNTDLIGLHEAAKLNGLLEAQPTAVWGGGGTLDVIEAVFPHAQFYSVRTALPRDESTTLEPEIVIWAANLKSREPSPPASWKPRVVLDLNYSDSSLAREYAVSSGALYLSGLSMFRAQAQAQREFWTKATPAKVSPKKHGAKS